MDSWTAIFMDSLATGKLEMEALIEVVGHWRAKNGERWQLGNFEMGKILHFHEC